MTIEAKIIADSISKTTGKRITTFELEYPRFILAELNTHKMLSKNSSSSRAQPVKNIIKQINANPAMPSHWGKNQPGMSAREECDNLIFGDSEFVGYTREDWWYEARDAAVLHAAAYDEAGYHKQVVNRILEPFTHMKTVLTGTEFENFFWLRDHDDAQPEIHILAQKMRKAMNASTPIVLDDNEWHVPYFRDGYWAPNDSINAYKDYAPEDVEHEGYTLDDALAISVSCCCQVSYRTLDISLEKAKRIASKLCVPGQPWHFSPFEHQATPLNINDISQNAEGKFNAPTGISAVDLREDNCFWSGNFKNWIQLRKIIEVTPDTVSFL
jgi:thymidylate synthase ThyX